MLSTHLCELLESLTHDVAAVQILQIGQVVENIRGIVAQKANRAGVVARHLESQVCQTGQLDQVGEILSKRQ